MALSATPRPDAVGEIPRRLQMRDVIDISTSFFRKNLSYSVIFREGGHTSGMQILREFLEKHKGEKGLVFCRRINECKRIAQDLQKESWKACEFYARRDGRTECLSLFTQHRGGLDILVTTKVLGVGVNLPNLKFVVHWEAPYTLTEYLQQSGRAGRDEKPAECVLLFSPRSMTSVPHDGNELHEKEIKERKDMILYAMGRRCRQASFPNVSEDVRCEICDNCRRKKSKFINVTERICRILGMYTQNRNPRSSDLLPTLNQLIDHFRGRKPKAGGVDRFLDMGQFGIGKNDKIRCIDIEYLIMCALKDELFKEVLTASKTPRGSTSYTRLEPGCGCRGILTRTEEYLVDFSPLKPVEM